VNSSVSSPTRVDAGVAPEVADGVAVAVATADAVLAGAVLGLAALDDELAEQAETAARAATVSKTGTQRQGISGLIAVARWCPTA